MSELQELKKKIKELNDEYNDLSKNQLKKEVLDLKWTQKCNAVLEISSISSVGLSKFQIWLDGKTPEYKGVVTFADSPKTNYLDYMNYTSNYFNIYRRPCLYTSSEKALINFLYKVKFKTFNFDCGTLEFLKKIEKYKNEQ